MDLVRVVAAVVVGVISSVGVRASAQLLSPGPLTRAHAELEGDANCERCHSAGRGIDTSDCLSCHEDLGARIAAGQGLHGREYRGRACGDCHAEHLGRAAPLIRWPGGARERFDHALSGWALEGGHVGLACGDCHDRRNSRGAATFLGESRECASCHEDPHESRFGASCASCHSVVSWSSVRMDQFDHSRTGYPLIGEHASVACADCHGRPPRYRGIDHDQCTDCHRDPHDERFAQPCTSCHVEQGWDDLARVRTNHPGVSLGNGHARLDCIGCHDQRLDTIPSQGNECVDCHAPVHEAPLGRDCASCHGTIRWLGLPRRVGERAHERAPFALSGAHATVDCALCHDPTLAPNARFRRLQFDKCRHCHDDPHRGEFAAQDRGECAPCHTDVAFRPSLFGVELHARTTFPLVGRHEAVPCAACHEVDIPRTWFRGAEEECADCHENPHGEQFAAEMAIDGCAHCHEPAGWDRPRIDHGVWPLTGVHELVSCNACHSPTDEDRRLGRGPSYSNAPRECAGCHTDAHAGQFTLSEPRRNCEDCHDTADFQIPAFDHAALTGFPLDGGHAAPLECSGCHPAVQLVVDGEPMESVRWRLGYRRCADCHADPHAEGAQ